MVQLRTSVSWPPGFAGWPTEIREELLEHIQATYDEDVMRQAEVYLHRYQIMVEPGTTLSVYMAFKSTSSLCRKERRSFPLSFLPRRPDRQG